MYDPVLDGRRTDFGVSGLLFQDSAVFYDRQSQGLWPQLTATAISGDYEGRKLQMLPFTDTTWGEWWADHPDTLVLSPETGYGRNYGLPAYATAMLPSAADGRLASEAMVWGVRVGDAAKAYPVTLMLHAPERFSDRVGGREIRIDNAPPGRKVSARFADGTPLQPVRMRWFAWSALYPETAIYEPAPRASE